MRLPSTEPESLGKLLHEDFVELSFSQRRCRQRRLSRAERPVDVYSRTHGELVVDAMGHLQIKRNYENHSSQALGRMLCFLSLLLVVSTSSLLLMYVYSN